MTKKNLQTIDHVGGNKTGTGMSHVWNFRFPQETGYYE